MTLEQLKEKFDVPDYIKVSLVRSSNYIWSPGKVTGVSLSIWDENYKSIYRRVKSDSDGGIDTQKFLSKLDELKKLYIDIQEKIKQKKEYKKQKESIEQNLRDKAKGVFEYDFQFHVKKDIKTFTMEMQGLTYDEVELLIETLRKSRQK